jgi:hypothetical protein
MRLVFTIQTAIGDGIILAFIILMAFSMWRS